MREIQVQTSLGIDVDVCAVVFARFGVGKAQGGPVPPVNRACGPVLVVPGQVIEAACRQGGAPMTVAFLGIGVHTGFAVVLVRGTASCTVLLADFGIPSVRHWLLEGRRTGRLPVVLTSPSGSKVVMARWEKVLAEALGRRAIYPTAGPEELEQAMRWCMMQFEDGQAMQELGLTPGTHRNVTVCMVLDAEVLDVSDLPSLA
jgi:hypothetical protein